MIPLTEMLRRKREAESRGGDYAIGFRAGLVFGGCWYYARWGNEHRIPGWWGWFS